MIVALKFRICTLSIKWTDNSKFQHKCSVRAAWCTSFTPDSSSASRSLSHSLSHSLYELKLRWNKSERMRILEVEKGQQMQETKTERPTMVLLKCHRVARSNKQWPIPYNFMVYFYLSIFFSSFAFFLSPSFFCLIFIFMLCFFHILFYVWFALLTWYCFVYFLRWILIAFFLLSSSLCACTLWCVDHVQGKNVIDNFGMLAVSLCVWLEERPWQPKQTKMWLNEKNTIHLSPARETKRNTKMQHPNRM